MRAIGTMMLLGLVAARPAAAEPPQTAPTSEKKAETKSEPAPRLVGNLAAMAATAAAGPAADEDAIGKAEARRLDLTPSRQFESGKLGKPSADRRGGERGSGIPLGDDSNWKVQAAQVGAMAALFTTLVAVCGNGNCLLPDFFGGGKDRLGPAPGVGSRPEPKLRDPR